MGGNAPIYLSNNLIRFDDHSKLKATEGFYIDGTKVDITLVKSRTAKAGHSITLIYNQNSGFDEELSLFEMMKERKFVNGAGAYLYLGEHTEYKFAQKQIKEKLATIPEFRQIFMETAAIMLREFMYDNTPRQREEVYEEDNYNMNQDILASLNGVI